MIIFKVDVKKERLYPGMSLRNQMLIIEKRNGNENDANAINKCTKTPAMENSCCTLIKPYVDDVYYSNNSINNDINNHRNNLYEENDQKKEFFIININRKERSKSFNYDCNLERNISLKDNFYKKFNKSNQEYDQLYVNKELFEKLNIKINSKNIMFFHRRNFRISYNFHLVGNNNILKAPKKIKLINNQLRKIKLITLKDYDALSPYELMDFDRRGFFRLFWDIAIIDHPILNLLFFNSLMEPLWVRFIVFLFEFKVGLAMSALFFSDDYIDARSEVPAELRVNMFFLFEKIFFFSNFICLRINFL